MMLPKQYDSHINVVMEDGKLLYVEHVTANIVIINENDSKEDLRGD